MFTITTILISCVFCTNLVKSQKQVTFTLANLGDITGVETQTKEYEGAPYSNRTYYKFRNIPYALPVIGPDRFKQSKIWNSSLLSTSSPYDATKTGPLCMQGSITPQYIDQLKTTTVGEIALTLIPAEVPPILVDTLVTVLLSILNLMLELEPNFLTKDKLVGDVLQDWLDVDLGVSEDCLHLSVSTPWMPDNTEKKALPVMFFVHGGAFYAGTQIRMGAERLGSWGEVIVVSINYRVGPLGFLCLDSDEAAGNMGMLDMVVALEWVHQYIGYFGGDHQQITIFGESAGSAAIGHLLLSDETNGLFSKGIGQSGSALASWAFDSTYGVYHAQNIAVKVGCTSDDLATHNSMVTCLRSVDAWNITQAFSDYSKEQRAKGELGFGGSIPCAQTRGERKFYTEGQDPEVILFSGDYEKVPIMFGANSHEGSYVYGVVYNQYLTPNNLTEDEHFLRHDLIHQLLKTVGVTNSYAVEHMIEEDYFDEWQMGNLTNMRNGIIDLLSVFFLKASSYEFVAENSNYKDSYWYAFDYQSIQKSVFHLLFLDPTLKADITDPGVCHADELMYIFDVELPIILCDAGQLSMDINECLDISGGLNLDEMIQCAADPNGPVRSKWQNCLTGRLTEEELAVSANILQMWTNFAINGNPGLGARTWSIEEPWYSRITDVVEIASNYRNEYHIASDEASTTTTSTTTTIANATTTTAASAAISYASTTALFVSVIALLIENIL